MLPGTPRRAGEPFRRPPGGCIACARFARTPYLVLTTEGWGPMKERKKDDSLLDNRAARWSHPTVRYCAAVLERAGTLNSHVCPIGEAVAKGRNAEVDYWSLVEPVWLRLNHSWDAGPEEFARLFRSVRPEIGHLYAAHWCQSEVRNGGLHQFFSNTTGLLAPEAMDGFRAIGAEDWGKILAQAMTHFGATYPRDRYDREEFLPMRQRCPREEWDPFYQLDVRFFDWADNWEDTANAYAEQVVAGGRG